MLATTSYPAEYLQACETRMVEQLASYEALVAATGPRGDGAARVFGPLFLQHMVLAMDACFIHRCRTLEGRDGNPLNEVRMLCHAMLWRQGLLQAEEGLDYRAEDSVLGLKLGETLWVDLAGMKRLVRAFFAELRQRYPTEA